jgi:fructuronate reductase
LDNSALGVLPPSVRRPSYDRRKVTPGIVHLGVGAFHRAHQAFYTDAILTREPRWGIVGASLRSPATREALSPQDGLYTLAVRSAAGQQLSVIGAIGRILVASDQGEALIAAMADPRVCIVSLTITEKGYCHDPASGALNEAHPDIVADLAADGPPRTSLGLIVEATRRRRIAGARPFTVLTCDNLPANGRLLKGLLDRFAALRDAELGAYVAHELACPSTMVDRITPATTPEDRDRIATALGCEDAWPVVTEPFTQWVIEDDFTSGRPPWEETGAEMVDDVAPYELMKLRLLNGSHSTLAYLGYLAGYETVAETMADPAFRRLVKRLMDEEIAPTLAVPPGADLPAYQGALIERFENPALKHRTWQIAMDGSQKLPQRLLGTIRDRLREGAPIPLLALAVAGWMRYVTGADERGRPIDVRDPLASRLRQAADGAGPDPHRLMTSLLGFEEIFGRDLPGSPVFRNAVLEALTCVLRSGARAAVDRP